MKHVAALDPKGVILFGRRKSKEVYIT